MKKNYGSNACVLVVSLMIALLWLPSSVFATSFMGLGDLPGGQTFSKACDISADGTVVVGYSISDDSTTAFWWDATNGMQTVRDLIGSPDPDQPEWHLKSALGVSADGAVIVGVGSLGGTPGLAYKLNRDISQVYFRALTDPMIGSAAQGISYDGRVVVGHSYVAPTPAEAHTEAFYWTSESIVGLGDLPGGDNRSEALDVSADGSVVVGRSWSDSGREAFRWDLTNGMVGLGAPDSYPYSEATGISADGSVVVGNAGTSPWRWDATNGMVDLGRLGGTSAHFKAWAVILSPLSSETP